MKEENLKEADEIMEKETVTSENETNEVAVIQGFNALGKRTNTKSEIFTNITDKKKMFNLDNHVDFLLNDCEGELIRVKEVLIKRYEKPLKEPVVDEDGVNVKEKEITMACILIDDNNKSYATGSKVFTIQMMRYLEMFGLSDEGFEIKIIKTKQDSGNKTLGFELV